MKHGCGLIVTLDGIYYEGVFTQDVLTVSFLHIHDLYSLPSIIRIMKPRRMRWVGHAT
jgi:hypothetical protein